MNSILTKKQVKVFKKAYREDGREYVLIAKVRYDDECGNGHNTFTITGEIWRANNGQPIGRDCESCGCIHDDIAKHFPELAPLLKWHLCGSDGPWGYIANTVYHARENGPTHGWVYWTGCPDPLGIGETKERCLAYAKTDVACRAEGQPDYRVKWDEKTVKVRNLAHARSSAVWPEATDDDLLAPGLEGRLRARLPRLMAEFKAAIEELGFIY